MRELSQDTIQIYLKSLTIRERLEKLSKVKKVFQDINLNEKVSHWKLQVGETSDAFFKKRLEWSNIKESDLSKLLSPIKSFDFSEEGFPEWLFFVEEFIQSDKTLYLNEDNKDTGSDIPFSNLLVPIVDYFALKLATKPSYVSFEAHEDLKFSLLKLLSKIASQSLLEMMQENGESYKEFVVSVVKNGYRNFLSKYSYLTRLIFIRSLYWVDNSNFLLKNLERDKLLIAGKLSASVEGFTVQQIETDQSESHNEGKNVAIIRTKYGSFAFKNRGVGIEEEFFSFLNYLNPKLKVKQYIPWLIRGNGYGWMQYIEHKECKDESQAANYFERVGSLSFIFYLLGATDLHSENVIAMGLYPVFIDLETILTPLPKLNNKHLNKLNEYIDLKYGLSVSKIGILPQWMLAPDTNVYNKSALGDGKKGLRYPNLVWKNINSDNMHLEYIDVESSPDKNLVYLGSKIARPEKYVNEILKGFKETYRLFLRNKESSELKDWISRFKNKEIRFVFRATKVYTLLLDYLNHPDFMRNGVIRSLEFEILAKGLLLDLSKKYIFWEVLDSELRQLEGNDIPYFVINTLSTELKSLNKVICENAFQYKGYNRLIKLLRKLDEEDLKFQIGIIRNTIQTEVLENAGTVGLVYGGVETNRPSEAVDIRGGLARY